MGTEEKIWTVYMALEKQTIDGTQVYEIENSGEVVKTVPTHLFQVHVSSGGWDLVRVPISQLVPTGWSFGQTCEWLEHYGDGFIAFDLEMIDEYITIDRPIKERAFNYTTVKGLIQKYVWLSKSDGEYTKNVGTKAQYLADADRTDVIIRYPQTRRLGA